MYAAYLWIHAIVEVDRCRKVLVFHVAPACVVGLLKVLVPTDKRTAYFSTCLIDLVVSMISKLSQVARFIERGVRHSLHVLNREGHLQMPRVDIHHVRRGRKCHLGCHDERMMSFGEGFMCRFGLRFNNHDNGAKDGMVWRQRILRACPKIARVG